MRGRNVGRGRTNRRRVVEAILGTLVALAVPSVAVSATEEQAPAAAQEAKQAPPAAQESATFPPEQLDQMVAPIALYPDSLLSQVLIASTYPLEVVEADRWRRQNAALKDDALDKALEAKDWDPSVEALTHFPDLLKRMADNLDWTKDLGDAFIAQQAGVMEAIQRMRKKAYDSGALKTSKEQNVVVEKEAKETVIKIEQADPQVVYVPQYAPQAVYGAPPAAAPAYYPSMYAYPPGYVATTSLLSFGVGMAVGAAVWGGGCDWGSHNVYNNYYGGG